MKLIKQEEVEKAAKEYADKIQSYSGNGAFRQGVNHAEKEFSKLFPNGFESWYKTFYTIVFDMCWIDFNLRKEEYPLFEKTHAEGGTGGLWQLTKELTDKFELLHKGREWDGEFFDEIEKFLIIELKKE